MSDEVELPPGRRPDRAGDGSRRPPRAVPDSARRITLGSIERRQERTSSSVTVTVKLLGGFEVAVDGVPVPDRGLVAAPGVRAGQAARAGRRPPAAPRAGHRRAVARRPSSTRPARGCTRPRTTPARALGGAVDVGAAARRDGRPAARRRGDASTPTTSGGVGQRALEQGSAALAVDALDDLPRPASAARPLRAVGADARAPSRPRAAPRPAAGRPALGAAARPRPVRRGGAPRAHPRRHRPGRPARRASVSSSGSTRRCAASSGRRPSPSAERCAAVSARLRGPPRRRPDGRVRLVGRRAVGDQRPAASRRAEPAVAAPSW